MNRDNQRAAQIVVGLKSWFTQQDLIRQGLESSLHCQSLRLLFYVRGIRRI